MFLIPFSIADNFIHNVRIKQTIMVAELNTEIEKVKDFLEEQTDMLQSLEEGIVVMCNSKLNFVNDIFRGIVSSAIDLNADVNE
jgi:hypothetical protein